MKNMENRERALGGGGGGWKRGSKPNPPHPPSSRFFGSPACRISAPLKATSTAHPWPWRQSPRQRTDTVPCASQRSPYPSPPHTAAAHPSPRVSGWHAHSGPGGGGGVAWSPRKFETATLSDSKNKVRQRASIPQFSSAHLRTEPSREIASSMAHAQVPKEAASAAEGPTGRGCVRT